MLTVDSGEIDLIFHMLPYLGFENWGNLILVECKNWSTRVNLKEVLAFSMKVLLAKAKTGILVARQGVTKSDAAAERAILNIFDTVQVAILVLTLDEIQGVANGEDLCALLLRKEFDLRVRRASTSDHRP